MSSLQAVFALKGFIWAYVLPIICLFGIVTNAINIYVFSKQRRKNLRNRMHQYFHLDSIVELVYLIIGLVYFILRTEQFRHLRNSYLTVLYEKFMFYYFSTSLAFFTIFLRVFISIKRLLIALNTGVFIQTIHFYQVIGSFMVVSLMIDLPSVINCPIVPKTFIIQNLNFSYSNQRAPVYYEMSYKTIENSLMIKSLNFLAFSVRGLIAPTLLLAISLSTTNILSRNIMYKTTINRYTQNNLRFFNSKYHFIF